jgi:UDP-glucuronate 4-epimerase
MHCSANPQVSGFDFQVSSSAWADIAKAKRLLGWSPQITPEEGFRRTVAWHLENGQWLKGIRL